MPRRRPKVTVTTDLESLAAELAPQRLLLVRPLRARKFPTQRDARVVEFVDLNTLNLARMEGFETV